MPIAIYTEHTTFEKPTLRVKTTSFPPLDIIAIDHLPSMLPREASETCSADLLPNLLHLTDWRTATQWKMALDLFREKGAQAAAIKASSELVAMPVVDKPKSARRPVPGRTLSGNPLDWATVIKAAAQKFRITDRVV
jgi:hypothetical protein